MCQGPKAGGVVARGADGRKLDGGGYESLKEAQARFEKIRPQGELVARAAKSEWEAKAELADVAQGEKPAGSRHLGKIIPHYPNIDDEPPMGMTPGEVFFQRAGNPVRGYADCCRSAEAERVYRERAVANNPDDERARMLLMDATTRHAGLLGFVMRYMFPTYQAISVHDNRGDDDLSIDEARSIMAEVGRSVDAVVAVSGCDDANVPRGTSDNPVGSDGD